MVVRSTTELKLLTAELQANLQTLYCTRLFESNALVVQDIEEDILAHEHDNEACMALLRALDDGKVTLPYPLPLRLS